MEKYGFKIKSMTIEEWLDKHTISGQELKVLKVQGFTYLQNTLTNELYLVDEPKKERIEQHADGVKVIYE